MCNKAIVYGTLRPGEPERIIRVKGKMYDIGWFPGVILGGDDDIIGEVIEVIDDEHLASLDRYEGYYENSPENSLYLRRKVVLDGTEYWIYEYNIAHRLDDSYHVQSGNWLEYTNEERGVNCHLAVPTTQKETVQ